MVENNANLDGDAHGEPGRTARLTEQAYDELRKLARHYLTGERPDHTLQPTALVHEAFIRLQKINRVAWKSESHFFAMAATSMRRILVEHARAANRRKRGGGARRITLTDRLTSDQGPALEVIALDQALTRLAASRPRCSRVAELRLFSGMRTPEIAEHLSISGTTVKQEWQFARAWLSRELAAGAERP